MKETSKTANNTAQAHIACPMAMNTQANGLTAKFVARASQNTLTDQSMKGSLWTLNLKVRAKSPMLTEQLTLELEQEVKSTERE